MSDVNHLTERQVTMMAIQWISRVGEALTQSVETGLPMPLARKAVSTAVRCAASVEHIAQYDWEGMEEVKRMSFIAQDLYWLVMLLPELDVIFREGYPFHYSIEDIKALGKLAWDRAGKGQLPMGTTPIW